MRKITKSLLSIASISLCLASSLSIADAATSPGVLEMTSHGVAKHQTLSLEHLPLSATKVDFMASSNSTVSITSATIVGSNVAIAGMVQRGNKSVPFNLQGTLYRSPIPNRVYAVVKDTLGNFNVDRLEFSQNPLHDMFINKSLSGPSLALYLNRTGTRNFTFDEVPLTDIFSPGDVQSLFSNDSNLPLNTALSNMTWLGKMFTPKITHTKSAITQGIPVPSKQVSVTNGTTLSSTISAAYATPASWTDTWELQYNGGALGTITDQIVLGFTVYEPNSFGSGTSYTAGMQVNQINYTESNQGATYHDITGWEIGGNSPDGFCVQTPSPYVTESAELGGNPYVPGSPSVSWSYSVGIGLFSGSFTYNPGGQTTLGQPVKLNYSDAQQVEIFTTGGEYLDAVGQNLVGTFIGANTSSTSSPTVQNTMNITYDLYNVDAVPPAGATNQPWIGYDEGPVTDSVIWPVTG